MSTATPASSGRSWRRIWAWLESLPPTGWHRHVLAYAALLLALPGLAPGILIALAGRDCTSLDCLSVGVAAVGAGFLAVLALMVWWARRLGPGVPWALLTTAGLTVLTVALMLNTIIGDRLPMVAVSAMALPAAAAWATAPDRAWWVRQLRMGIVAAGVAAVVAFYQATG